MLRNLGLISVALSALLINISVKLFRSFQDSRFFWWIKGEEGKQEERKEQLAPWSTYLGLVL